MIPAIPGTEAAKPKPGEKAAAVCPFCGAPSPEITPARCGGCGAAFIKIK